MFQNFQSLEVQMFAAAHEAMLRARKHAEEAGDDLASLLEELGCSGKARAAASLMEKARLRENCTDDAAERCRELRGYLAGAAGMDLDWLRRPEELLPPLSEQDQRVLAHLRWLDAVGSAISALRDMQAAGGLLRFL